MRLLLLPLAACALRAPLGRRELIAEAAAAASAAALAPLAPAGAAAPRWAEGDAVLPTEQLDPGKVFRDLEDGFEVAYPTRNWMRTQPLPELLGGAPSKGTRFAAADLGQSAVIAVTCQPRAATPAWPSPAARPAKGGGAAAAVEAFATQLLEDRAQELAWSSCRLTSAALVAADRVEFVGKAYFDVPNDVPIVRKEIGVSVLKPDRILTAWASAPVDTIAANDEVSRFLPAIIATFRAT